MSLAGHVLVVGGQRSGKSRFAENLVEGSGLAPVYIATAEPGDDEMAERIAAHRARRGLGWRVVEEPLALPGAIASERSETTAVLVDCLTLWLANLMGAGRDIGKETQNLVASLGGAKGPVVFVSNEVGLGIVPADPLSRRFADSLGILNQTIGRSVARVVLMAAGIPLNIKPAREFAF
jgi:adenosylcobinamide kinase / adenosylcobinamide-phosphate guanylyltransferase